MLLNGYLGASSEEGCERLYRSPNLKQSCRRCPRRRSLNRAAMPKEQDANGGVTLWVKKDAALQYKLAPAAQALANYFAGAIQAAQAAGGGAQAAAAVTVGACADVATANCTLRCATEITPRINTHANTCYCPVTHGCPTQNQLCQSQGQCTWIGCGHTLACTYGLLARACPRRSPRRRLRESHAQMRDGNHASHQHRREHLLLSGHRWLPDAKSCLPVAGSMHLDRGCGHTLACTYGSLCAAAAPAAASVNCTLRCATEITPCINTHANTCYCPVTAWLPDAKSALPEPGPVHLYRLRTYPRVYVRIVVQRGRGRRRSVCPAADHLGLPTAYRGVLHSAVRHRTIGTGRRARAPPGAAGDVLQAQAFQQAAGGANVSGWWFCQAPSLFCTNPAVCRSRTANTRCCPM